MLVLGLQLELTLVLSNGHSRRRHVITGFCNAQGVTCTRPRGFVMHRVMFQAGRTLEWHGRSNDNAAYCCIQTQH